MKYVLKIMDDTTSSFSCELCHKSFSQASSRNRHVREKHLQPSLFHCGQCGSRFSKKYNLKVHIEHVHSKNRKQIKSSHCDYIFTKSASFHKHVEDHRKFHRAKEYSNTALENGGEMDAQSLAETVLRELKQLQEDMQAPEQGLPVHLESEQEPTNIEKRTEGAITIKDSLYPLGHFKLLKTKTIKREDGIIYLTCEFCDKEFRKTYNFLRHRRVHTKVRPFVCALCKKTFPTVAQLRLHCSIHKLNEKFGLFHKLYKCPKCNACFSAIQQLDKHLSSSSGCNVIFQCPSCSKSFTAVKSLLRHKHSKRDNELDILKSMLPAPLQLNEEVQYASNNKRVFECHFCAMQINEEILFRQHVKRHEHLFKNQCAKCRSSFVTESALKIHNKIHLNTKNFKCQYCSNCFRTAKSCRRHMETHLKRLLQTHDELQNQRATLDIYPTFVENRENRQTETVMSFIRFRNKCNTKEDKMSPNSKLRYACPRCEKSFRYKSWMEKHFKYKHTNLLSFKCSKCSKEFRTKQTLESHFLVHSTERVRITCQVCGRQYASNKSLKLHLRIHTQEKPFNCEKCEKVFRTSGHLIQHCKSNHKEKS